MATCVTYHIAGFGLVDVVEQNDTGNRFWDLFGASGECLNEGSPFWMEPTRCEVEQFLALQLKEILTRLEVECERNQISQADLDERVHEAAQSMSTRLNDTTNIRRQDRLISAAEAEAARINNEGRARQRTYLLEAYGADGAIQALQQSHHE